MKLLVLLAIIGIVASYDSSLDSEWENFKATHGKNYKNPAEHDRRRLSWEDNRKKVLQHNLEYSQGSHTYSLSINKYSDMNSTEFVQTMNGYKATKKVTVAVKRSALGSPQTLSTNCCTFECLTTSPYFAPNTLYYLENGDFRFFVYPNGTISLMQGLPAGTYNTSLKTVSTSGTINPAVSVNITVNCLVPAVSTQTLSTSCCTFECATTSPYFTLNTLYYLGNGDLRFFVYPNGTISLMQGLPAGTYNTSLKTASTSGTINPAVSVNITVNCLTATTLAPVFSTATAHVATTATPAATVATSTTHTITTVNPATTTTSPTTATTTTASSTIPTSVDWRTQGYVTAVKDQGQCGACWSFSATGTLEGQHFKKTGTLVSLSEQQLVDCVTSSNGCGGGRPGDAFQYIVTNKGIDTEASYPYTATDILNGDTCKYTAANLGATVASNSTYPAGYVSLTTGSEMALMSAVATIGPISAAIDASDPSFQNYASGVYGPSTCSSSLFSLDHGVLVVGYGHDSVTKLDYWLVKNSWSTSWGIGGYFWLARNKNNMCGIATEALYPLV